MASVYITTSRPSIGGAHERLRKNAARDRFGVHRLTDDAEEADLILFVDHWNIEPFFGVTRRHPLVQAHREKCFCVSETDYAFPFLPGVYADCRRRWYRKDRVRSGFYFSMFENPRVGLAPASVAQPYLFSFVGSADTHPLRTRVLDLQHPRSLLKDTSDYAYRIRWEGTEKEKDCFHQQYSDALWKSQFALCPRGLAVSTRRMFDAMQAGRVPVILSDDWVPPVGPDWAAFSLRVPEADVGRVPALLERAEYRAAAMGAAARRAWEQWFARDVCFHRIVEWCLSIRAARQCPERLLRLTAIPHLLHPPYLRIYLGSRWRLLRQEGWLVP